MPYSASDVLIKTTGILTRSWAAVPSAPTISVSNPSAAVNRITATLPDDADTWIVQRSDNGSTGWSQIGTEIDRGTLTYDDTPASSGTYYYRARCVNGVGQSAGFSPSATGTVTVGTVGDWQLPLIAGEVRDPRVFDMVIAHPRPQAETQAWAISKTGLPGVRWTCPIEVFGGSPPYRYEIITGPAMLTVGSEMQTAADAATGKTLYTPNAEYGLLIWDGPTAGTHTIRLRVYDQQYQRGSSPSSYAEVEFSPVFSAAGPGSVNIILDPVGGNDTTGDGSAANPFRTMTKLHSGTIAYAGKAVWLRGGTHTFAGMAAYSGNYYSNGGSNPDVFIGYPGETAIVESGSGWFRFNGSDAALKDLTIRHTGAWGNSQKMVVFQDNISRHIVTGCRFENYRLGTSVGENGAVCFFDHAGSNSGTYACYTRNYHTGTQGTGVQSYGLRKAVIAGNEWESCTFSQSESSGPGVIYLKDDANEVSVRGNECWSGNTWSGTIFSAFATAGQNGGINNVEVCYNTFHRPVSGRAATVNWGTGNGFPHTNVYEYRNSYRNGVRHELTGATLTNVNMKRNALDTGSFPATAGVTFADNQQGRTLFDSNMKLTGTDRTSYLGLIGAEFAA